MKYSELNQLIDEAGVLSVVVDLTSVSIKLISGETVLITHDGNPLHMAIIQPEPRLTVKEIVNDMYKTLNDILEPEIVK